MLEIHGGPNSAFMTAFNPLHQIIAGAGCIVLFTNPRGSTSYGADFTSRVLEDWGGEDYLDLMAAVDAACRRPYVDERRLGVHGYSYGGFMASWIVGHTDRFKAAVVGAPVINLLSMYGTTDIGVPFGEEQWGGRPPRNLDWYLERSPLTYGDRVQTPVLLLHGEADIRCPIGQSEEYFVALKRQGKTVEFVRFPDCSHLFLRTGHPALRKEYYDRVAGGSSAGCSRAQPSRRIPNAGAAATTAAAAGTVAAAAATGRPAGPSTAARTCPPASRDSATSTSTRILRCGRLASPGRHTTCWSRRT